VSADSVFPDGRENLGDVKPVPGGYPLGVGAQRRGQWLSPSGGCAQTRCTATTTDDGMTQVARYKSSADGVSWSASMDVTLRKVT
jgi:hypothetical protein